MSRFLGIFRRGKRGELTVRDLVTGAPVKLTDELTRRYFLIGVLTRELGYPRGLLDVDVEFVVGGRAVGRADIVVYRDGRAKDPISGSYIVAIARDKGLGELKELMRVSEAEYGLWSDGADIVVLGKGGGGVIDEVGGIPKYGYGLDSLNVPVSVSDMVPAADLTALIEGFVRYLKRHEKELGDDELFDELLKLLLLKAISESLGDETCMWLSNEEYVGVVKGFSCSKLKERVGRLLSRLGAYGLRSSLRLSDRSLTEFLRRFGRISILRSSDLAKAELIHTIARDGMDVGRDGTLTPPVVAELMVKLVRPAPGDLVVDPACGSGTLIIHVARYLRDTHGLSQQDLGRFLGENTLCIDVNPSMLRLATIGTALCGAAPTNALVADALSEMNVIQDLAVKSSIPARLLPRYEGFDVVLAHPPFNVRWRVRDPKVLSQFELGFRWRYDSASMRWVRTPEVLKEQLVEVVFIERCFQLLKPYGRMAILLPEEVLTSGHMGYVRQWIAESARVLAVVSLPHPTLVAYGTKTRAFVLALQRVPGELLEELRKSEYKVFVASVEKVGYDALGNPVFKKDVEGVVLTDESGRPVLDTDVGYVVRAFNEYVEREGIRFGRPTHQ